MEVNSLEINTHLLDLSHTFVNLQFRIKVIAKFAGEGSGKVIRGLLLYGYSPQDTHIGSILLDFDKFI